MSYTKEQTEQLTQKYEAGAAVEVIAAELGKTARSVIAKLAQLKLYQKQDATAVKRVTKAEMITEMAKALDVSYETLKSLEKADRVALVEVLRFLLKTGL